jgi:hypothetical protein
MNNELFVMKGNFHKEFLLSLGFEKAEVPLIENDKIGHIVPMAEPVGKKYFELYCGVEQPGSSLGS